LLAYTGVRYGEMAAVRVNGLDMLRRLALVDRALADVAGRVVHRTPKTHQTRSVPTPRFLIDDLARLVTGKAPGPPAGAGDGDRTRVISLED
jgi:hypothetical protein